jgi:hypothetical protein
MVVSGVDDWEALKLEELALDQGHPRVHLAPGCVCL